jgi:hypothetical protein
LKLDDQIRSLQAGELIAAGTPPETVQTMKVDPTNYSRLLKALYFKTVGTNTNAAAATMASNSPAPAVMTNASETVPVAKNAASHPPAENAGRRGTAFVRPQFPVKGGELMVRSSSPESAFLNPVAPAALNSSTQKPANSNAAANPIPGNAAGTNTVAEAPPEPTQEQMFASLLATIQISSDDLRALMQARARSVQAALVNTGKVEAARLFILAPAPISPTANGEARANLSLE